MAFVKDEQLCTLSTASPHIPNTDLAKEWSNLICYLGSRWWGYVSEEDVKPFLFISDFASNPAVVSGCFLGYKTSGTIPGGVCSFTISTMKGTRTYHVQMKMGKFWCEGVTNTCSNSLVDQVLAVCEKFNATLLRKPPGVQERTDRFTIDNVIAFAQNTQPLYLGFVWENAMFSIAQNLQAMKWANGGEDEYAALISSTEGQARFGYLMEIITRNSEERYHITFDCFGFNLIHESKGCVITFKAIPEPLKYISENLRLRLIR